MKKLFILITAVSYSVCASAQTLLDRFVSSLEKTGVQAVISYITVVAATLYCPETGIKMTEYTNEPGIQVYSGNFLDGTAVGKNGVTYNKRAGICLESQHFPDNPNKHVWASSVLRPGEKYYSHCIFAFSVENE